MISLKLYNLSEVIDHVTFFFLSVVACFFIFSSMHYTEDLVLSNGDMTFINFNSNADEHSLIIESFKYTNVYTPGESF